MATESFFDRPTRPRWREWTRHVSRIRWERRLARAPYYTLGKTALLILAIGFLIWAVR